MDATTEDQRVELERMRRLSLEDHTAYVFDLTVNEQRRLAAVLDATPDFDPVTVFAAEAEAYRMLYSGLDAEQQAAYQLLVDAGALNA
jgi:Family of unknown function (DUF6400)